MIGNRSQGETAAEPSAAAYIIELPRVGLKGRPWGTQSSTTVSFIHLLDPVACSFPLLHMKFFWRLMHSISRLFILDPRGGLWRRKDRASGDRCRVVRRAAGECQIPEYAFLISCTSAVD